MEELERVEVKKVAGPIEGGAAIFLGNDKKTFVIFVGIFEATAILKEIQSQKSPRPLTHDLIHNVFLGFDIRVKRVVISNLIENTFCATLVLEQQTSNGDTPRRAEVRIDARASDSIVIALKEKTEIWVAPQVFAAVEDVSHKFGPEGIPGMGGSEEGGESEGMGFDIEEEPRSEEEGEGEDR